MNRLQMYAAVYAFERDIRAIIRSYLDDGHGLEELMGDEDREKLQERHARAQKSGQTVDPVDLLDLRPSYDLLNRHRAELPSELAAEVRANTDRLDVLVPIRQRLMHARPLAPEDPERLLSSLYCFTHPRWKATHAVLEAVGDPTWVPDVEPELVPDAVLHNLPAADYDETGLIGRSVKASEIAQMLISGRESVLTLTGEGGIGKTALALDVAYRLVEEIDPPFEVILWVSLKQERLTGMGVLQIRNSINSLSDAAEHMGRGIDPTFSGGVSDLAAALEGIRTGLPGQSRER